MSFAANSDVFAAHALGLFFLIVNKDKFANPGVLRPPMMVFALAFLVHVFVSFVLAAADDLDVIRAFTFLGSAAAWGLLGVSWILLANGLFPSSTQRTMFRPGPPSGWKVEDEDDLERGD